MAVNQTKGPTIVPFGLLTSFINLDDISFKTNWKSAVKNIQQCSAKNL